MAKDERYEGRVISVEGDTFTAELIDCDDHATVYADFPMTVLSGGESVEPGDIIDVSTNPPSVKLRDLGRWTEADLRAIRERAAAQAAEFAAYVRYLTRNTHTGGVEQWLATGDHDPTCSLG